MGLGHFGRGHLGRGHYGRGHLGRGHYGRGHLVVVIWVGVILVRWFKEYYIAKEIFYELWSYA